MQIAPTRPSMAYSVARSMNRYAAWPAIGDSSPNGRSVGTQSRSMQSMTPWWYAASSGLATASTATST